MRRSLLRQARRQDGFTLIEVIITAAISVIVLGALTSVVLTSVQSFGVASSRVQASAQIRSFENYAYDDFAAGQIQNVGSCTQSNAPCSTQLVIAGMQASNSPQPVLAPYQVTYSWGGSSTGFLDRQVAATGATTHAATNVSSFAWYVDSSAGFPTVLVSLTVTVQAYSESQTFRFYPRLNP